MDKKLTKEYNIEIYPWGGDYRPKTHAELTFLPQEGLRITMQCEETEPRAVYECSDSPVCQDSCLECFIQFYPTETEKYINFEVNAKGCMLSAIGPDRYDRTPLRDLGISLPHVEVTRTEKSWQVSYLVSFELVRTAYGRTDDFQPENIKGNFYKCGDKTDWPHYGCWAPVAAPQPDYHRPECFQKLLV